MNTDIDLRFVERAESQANSDGNLILGLNERKIKVLQWRKRLNKFEWTEWVDVPFVRIEE